MFKLKMLPAMRSAYEEVLGIGRYWSSDRVIELCDPETRQFQASKADDPMWGRIILRSAMAGGGLEAATAKAAWLDECGQDEFPVEAWEAVLRRLSIHQGKVLGTTTLYNLGWVKSEVYERWLSGDPDYAWIEFDSAVNPAFPHEEMERARRTLPPWKFAMQYQGRFSRPAGLIYDCFQPEFHVVDDFPIPAEWVTYCGTDFGGVNTAFVWLAHDRAKNRYFLFSESLEGGMTTREHARRALDKAAAHKFLAAWGGAKSEEQMRRDYEREGFRIKEPGIWDVEAGIDRVYRLIKEDRLFVFRSCKGVLDELGSYRRKLDGSGQPTEDIADKRLFHRLDALRYAAAGMTNSAKNPIAGLVLTGKTRGW